MLQIVRVSSENELVQIKLLQTANLKHLISASEAQTEGFVTAEYDIELLNKMHAMCPSIIAKDGDTVVGYALVTVKELYGENTLIDNLFNDIDALTFKGCQLKNVRYLMMGQVCVAKGYRGKGLAQKMYQFYKDCLQNDFDYLITDVSSLNTRSLIAHEKAGFQIIHSINHNGTEWKVILWDWTL